MSINNKQYALIKFLANKHLNNLDIHIKLFNALIKSAYIYAAPTWMWKKSEILESIQIQYFKRIFHLQINSPAYLIYSELGIRPLKVNLIQATFNFWIKIMSHQKPKIAWLELQFWLKHMENKDNPWLKFFQSLIIPPHLKIISPDLWSIDQINQVRMLTLESLEQNFRNMINKKIEDSWNHPHYNLLGRIEGDSKPYLRLSFPWIVKRLILQLRIDPVNIYFQGTTINLSPTDPCYLCNDYNQTFDHLLLNCKVVLQKIKYPPKLPAKGNQTLLIKILKEPTEPAIWYLFNILKLIKENLNEESHPYHLSLA